MPLLSVFTATFNRGYIINNLFESLMNQTCYDFEWIVIDDGSVDNTEIYFDKLIKDDKLPFRIKYQKTQNNGKMIAINQGIELAEGKYFFIVDSDDFLVSDAIEKLRRWIYEVDNNTNIVGVGAARAYPDMTYIKGRPPLIDSQLGYIDASNLERDKYDLDADMCEAYKIDILKKYPFSVWKGEKFTPESVVFNEIALDGYKLRWHKDIIYICEYLEDGLTKGSDKLIKNNPMGYAMMYNHMLKYGHGIKRDIYYSIQMNTLAIYSRNYLFIV